MVSEIKRLEGKVAIVTGGGTGIGKVTALLLAKAGADVVIAARRVEALEVCAKEIRALGAKALVIPTDVTVSEQVNLMVERTISEMGKLDVLINNAGIVRGGPRGQLLWDITDETYHLQMDTNLTGAFFGCRAVSKYFSERKSGKVINISSEMALRGAAGGYMYCMAKEGVVSLTRSMALSMAQHNVQVNCILPGMTEVWQNQPPLEPGEQPRKIGLPASLIPMGRYGQPADIANLCLFLASEASDYITGAAFNGDGGRLAGGFAPTGYSPIMAMEE